MSENSHIKSLKYAPPPALPSVLVEEAFSIFPHRPNVLPHGDTDHVCVFAHVHDSFDSVSAQVTMCVRLFVGLFVCRT